MQILTVGQFTSQIKEVLEGAFGHAPLYVSGEVSGYRGRHQSGHCYFTLKDERAVLPVVMFSREFAALGFPLAEGMKVLARGRLNLYEPQGKYSFILDQLQPAGLGALYLRFEQLKRELEAEGLFALERKRPLPLLPLRIGVITSPTGAALRDVLNGLFRRYPRLEVVVLPVLVQGAEAVPTIVAAFDLLRQDALGLELVILCRGGGSLEDLWAFNERAVASAIATCPVPVISGVGHTTDLTIADLVADVRATTPANAAELAVTPLALWEERLEGFAGRLEQVMDRRLSAARQQLDRFGVALPEAPALRLSTLYLGLDHQLERLQSQAGRLVSRYRARLLAMGLGLYKGGARVGLLRGALVRLGERLRAAGDRKLLLERNSLTFLVRRLAPGTVRQRLGALRSTLLERKERLERAVGLVLTVQRRDLAVLLKSVEGVQVERVLQRGYALVRDKSRKLLRRAEEVAPGTVISVRLAVGEFQAEVGQREDGDEQDLSDPTRGMRG